MRLEASDIEGLKPVIESVVQIVLDRLQSNAAKVPADRLAFPEAEAAALLGLPRHVLRDARLRGEIVASRAGKKPLYAKADLLAYLNKTRGA